MGVDRKYVDQFKGTETRKKNALSRLQILNFSIQTIIIYVVYIVNSSQNSIFLLTGEKYDNSLKEIPRFILWPTN